MSDRLMFSVHSASAGSMLASHQTASQTIHTDEPPTMGGAGSAPNPIELLLAAWSGCIIATARMVARERGIDLGEVTANVEGTIDPHRVRGDRSAQVGLCSARAVLQISQVQPLPWLRGEIEARCPISGTIQRSGAEVEVVIEAVPQCEVARH